ncbi:MAG: DUF2933 domain-containing protein [Filomicrobium sp.]|nr:DUF2933 domain-containing protein [Filomicrobium sp.]
MECLSTSRTVLAVAALLLAYEHRIHIFTGNVLLILLALCIGMHHFMHGGHNAAPPYGLWSSWFSIRRSSPASPLCASPVVRRFGPGDVRIPDTMADVAHARQVSGAGVDVRAFGATGRKGSASVVRCSL